jgi:hypothetical protein
MNLNLDLEEILEKLKSALAEEDWSLVEDVIDILWQYSYAEEVNELNEEDW